MKSEVLQWVNYHHLRYFWAVAHDGGVQRAAKRLHITPSTVSAQIHQLEETLGEKLFVRRGRGLVLTEAGRTVLFYAEEIFTMGREMIAAIQKHPEGRPQRLHLGITDSLPKLVARAFLRPAFDMNPPVRMICREGNLEVLLGQLASHQLDLILADEKPSGSGGYKMFYHSLGKSDVLIMASPILRKKLKRNFPRSLNASPALVPTESLPLRRGLEAWFSQKRIRPQIVLEADDTALLKDLGAQGLGWVAIPASVASDAQKLHGLEIVGPVPGLSMEFFAISAERRIEHPLLQRLILKG